MPDREHAEIGNAAHGDDSSVTDFSGTKSPATSPNGRLGAIRERLGWSSLEHRIPPVANRLPYMLGGLTLFGITVLIATGMLLDQFYSPTPLAAHDSVVFIMSRVTLGNWVRGLHYWGATVAFVSMFLHLCYVFYRRGYARPREVTWLAGVGLFILLFALVFTGTVLKADQEGGEALAHAVAGAKMSGPPGLLLSPEFAASTTLLTRLHNAHVSVLPILLLALLGLHLMLIRVHGIKSSERSTVPFTHHVRRLSGFALLLFAFLATLAAVFPPALGHPAVEGVEITKPFWPFLWIYAVENTFGMVGMIIAPAILFGFLFAVPLLDRGHRSTDVRPRARWVLVAALIVLALYVGGIIYGVFAPQVQHLGM